MNKHEIPILIPYEQSEFWKQIGTIVHRVIKEELAKNQERNNKQSVSYETTGLTQKPLFKMHEVCAMFQVTRPTIYEWIKDGKLKPFKIKSRLFFLYSDIEYLMKT